MKYSLLILLTCFLSCAELQEQEDFIKEHEINSVAMENLEDGNYKGAYTTGFVTAEVEVIVENKIIKEIKLLEHDNLLGKAGEEVIVNVINNQDLEVDVISGATLSSKVILSAIENALTNPIN